jgi:DNA polymerase-3 subunit delta
MTMITKQVRDLMAVKDLSANKFSEPQIVAETGLHPFVVKKAVAAARNLDMERLMDLHRGLITVDASLKTGQGEPKVLLTRLLASS